MDAKYPKRYSVQGVEKNKHFSNCFVSSIQTDGRLMAINDKYLAFAFISKGNIKLLDSSQPINLANNYSTYQLEDSNILDMEFSPFDNDLLCFSNDNSHVFLSKINYKSQDNIKINLETYRGHEKKVNFINFNPIASNIMVSSTSYGDINVWESKEFKTYMKLKLAFIPSTILWSPNGDLIGTTQKNKMLTIYDPRNKNSIFEGQISQNSLITKFAWLDNNTVTTVSMNKENRKVLSLIDIRKSNSYQYDNDYISSIEIDKYTNMTVPFVNPELKLIYCVGKEENKINSFDYCTGSLKKNSEFHCSERNNFSVLLNRQYLNKSKMEVDRLAIYTINKNIFYVSFNLASRQNFDGILYPSEELALPQMDSNEWLIGKKIENIQKKIYHKRTMQNNISIYKDQNNIFFNNTEKKNTTSNKYLKQFLNLENNAKNDDSKLLNSASKNKDSNILKQDNYENLNKDFEKDPKSLESKIIDLQNLLKNKEKEKVGLSIQVQLIEEKNKYFKLEINKYERIIKDLENDYKQKEERSLKNIANLKNQINEIKLLLKSKEVEITKKDNIIKENQLKIKSLEEEIENKLNKNNIEDIKLEYEKKISLLKEQLKKNYEDEINKKIEVIKNQYEEKFNQELNNKRKNLIKTVGSNLKNLKDKYNNLFSSKEEELKKMCDEIIQLNLNIKEKEIYNEQTKEKNSNPKNEITKFPFTLSENEYIILLIIMTKDEKVMFPLMCKNTDKLNKIKEIFFKEFPEYSVNNGNFYCHNNNLIKNDETLEECKIKTNDIIIFDYV